MKKLMKITCLLLLFACCIPAGAQTRAKGYGAKKKVAAPALVVTKGETKEYGDYLTTQLFTIKKGKSYIKVEYPTSGNPKLVNALRKWEKEMINNAYTGTLETPDALLKSAARNIERGESLQEEVKVIFSSPEMVTLYDDGYIYFSGAAHGSPIGLGRTFFVKDGSMLTTSQLPSIDKIRPYIIKGLAKYMDVSESELPDVLFTKPAELEYPTNEIDDTQSNIYYTSDGLTIKYAPYEIGPYAIGMPEALIPAATVQQLLNPQTPKASKNSDNGNVFVNVEQVASFPGGQSALFAWLSNNLRYPEAAQQNNIQGKVIVQFLISKDGSISGAKVMRGVDPDLDKEALRVISKMPKWIPGKNNGENVNSIYTLPITFKLQN